MTPVSFSNCLQPIISRRLSNPVESSFKYPIERRAEATNTIKDSFGKNHDVLQSLNLCIFERNMKRVESYDELINAYLNHQTLTAIVSIGVKSKNITMEFPLNHFNLLLSRRSWQVETGPVLCPYPLDSFAITPLFPSFIFFNSYEYITIMIDYPNGRRVSEGGSDQAKSLGITCSVQIYRDAA